MADINYDQQASDASHSKRANFVDVYLGQRVRLRRLVLGLSQEKLGELLKITFQQVQKYERGTNRISASRLYFMARELGVPVGYFYEGLEQEGSAATPGFAEAQSLESTLFKFIATREGVALIREFERITDPAKRRAVLDIIRAMAGESPAQT
jgi:transcriptional regulator with XRE-family HTH domain